MDTPIKGKGIGIIILVVIGLLLYSVAKNGNSGMKDSEELGKLNGNPTTFSRVGTINFVENDSVFGIPYFSYTEENSESATTTLVFDEMSYCAAPNGSTPCMAMSVTLDIPFGNKEVVIEGIEQGEEVLVRKLRIPLAEETPIAPQPGSVFISWPQTINFINSCGVKMVMQTHELDVYLTMKDDTVLRAVEPVIDEIFSVVQTAQSTCGDIPVATE